MSEPLPSNEERLDALEGALADLNRRLAASERRQAQTIEAVSEEIKRMHDRFNQRQDALSREFGERLAELSGAKART